MNKKLLSITGVVLALGIYFALSVFYLPGYYASFDLQKPMPIISDVNISDSSISLGNSFGIEISATNSGDTSDFQLVTVAFPNMTDIENSVRLTTYDFLQSPVFIETGEQVGSSYSGPARTVIASYPSIESYSRPWKSDENYQIGLEVTPVIPGTFFIYVKSISFPHTHEMAHFPQTGILDYQDEFVDVYSVEVNKP